MKNIKWFLIKWMWRIPWVARRYCWADAVMWAEFKRYPGEDFITIGRAKHDCFYCMACNTDAEIKAYQDN